MHIHLDPVGGVAGDMFVAAVLDAWPELVAEVVALPALAGLPGGVIAKCLPHRDRGLAGTRFQVSNERAAHEHLHVPFNAIREQLLGSTLPAAVAQRALAIFNLLAEAEASVHGVTPDAVTFHEVGNWDSITDIVSAAFLIDRLNARSWSIAALPLGAGRVSTAHGLLPVPAPATALLLRDFVVHDDGRSGERVTPTGAAILKHLAPTYRPAPGPMRLGRTGIGFGARRLDGLPNMLRLIVLEDVETPRHEEIAVIQFEVDDQPAEDLALGLDRLRALDGVIDIVQAPVYAKHGRISVQIQLLARPEAVASVRDQCFLETTTLGLRWHIVQRAVLERRQMNYRDPGDHAIGVKIARRPDGRETAKAELRDVARAGGHAERARRRQRAETTILHQRENDDAD